jgi:hypothetical protein
MANYIRNTTSEGVSIGVNNAVSDPPHRLHHYPLKNNGGEDIVGSDNASIKGPSWLSNSSWYEGNALNFDGNSDELYFGTLSSFGSQLDTDWCILATLRTTSTGRFIWGEASTSSGDGSSNSQRINIAQYSNRLKFEVADIDRNNTLRADGDAITSPDDGNRHRYVFNKTDNSASGMEVWQDGQELTTTIKSDEALQSVKDFDIRPVVAMFQLYNGGFKSSYRSGDLDNVIFCTDSLVESEIINDYKNQPWQ